MVTKPNEMSNKNAGVKNNASVSKNAKPTVKKTKNNPVRNGSKNSSPYSSRGSSPAGTIRKSRSADERLDFIGKPPSSRGSE